MKSDFLYPDIKIVKGYQRLLAIDFSKNDAYSLPFGWKGINNSDLDNSLFFKNSKLISSLIKGYDESLVVKSAYTIQNTILLINDQDFPISEYIAFQKRWNTPYLTIVMDRVDLISEYEFFTDLENLSLRNSELIIKKPFIDSRLSDLLESKVFSKVVSFGHESNKVEKIKHVLFIFRKGAYEDQGCSLMSMDFSLGSFFRANRFNLFYEGKIFWANHGAFESESLKLKLDVNSGTVPSNWLVSKDDCLICSDCEFRKSCHDSRIPIRLGKTSRYVFNTECNYNPYIAKWKGEEGYRTLAECGVKSDETGFSIDHERIATINEELWGEDQPLSGVFPFENEGVPA